ncbi:efflux RND transporter periplasmic adaptor subunit [Kriegella aquimaris]|uniref:Membrane fusion protein, multidrug efflux system n=1 Tax=Kriegella aquimaris TaxID=192904 RepID=A0A1G9LR55_9FLAO|nr:efflux RND transporter periplasmic adaptor subunit [Kriegella aquimaris]SDL64294.1 membrane fusion protein, multidrug efflux system [Kriegella aquimaris]
MKQNLSSSLVSVLVLMVFLLTSCGSKTTEQKSESAQPYPTIQVAKRTVEDIATFPASIEGLVNSTIRAKVPGYIQSVLVDEGQQVKKGQLLFKLETESLTQDAGAAKARINVAQVEVDKLKPLVEKNIIGDVQLETAMANLEQAKSNYQSVTANIGYANIKSPVDGVIGSIPFRKGNLVSSQDASPLTTVSSISQVYAYFSMNEKDLIGFLKKIKGETLDEKAGNLPKVQLRLADGSIYDHEGQIETIAGEINPNTGTVKFRATFANPEGFLRNGSSGTILLPEKMEDVLVVPALSTFEQQGKTFVYLVQGDTLVTKNVDPKATIGGVVVIEGINEGDEILAKGVNKVRPGTKIVSQPTTIDSITSSFETVFK